MTARAARVLDTNAAAAYDEGMRGSSRRWVVVVGAWMVVGCGDDAGGATDTAPGDGDASAEVAAETIGSDDVAVDSSDVAVGSDEVAVDSDDIAVDSDVAADSGAVPLPGFGAISGACGNLGPELTSPSPSLFVNHYDFGADPYDDADIDRLTDGGRKILADGNAGGSSILSEVFAFEMLARCEGAVLLKTEREVVYDEPAKITDMVVQMHGHKIGANPTRAIGFPFDAPYTVEQARTILEKKLGDINSSTATVSAEDRWEKQILTVFAYADSHVAPVEEAWNAIDPALRADTIVIVTVTDGDDTFIYSNQ